MKIFKKWWFWLIVLIVIFILVSSSNSNNNEMTKSVEQEIIYETVDLQIMLDDLKNNAMKAEAKYQDKYIEFTCKVANFDSDGAYISVDPINSSNWNLISTMCYIKNDTQKDFLIQKNIGDIITIKGYVKSIGEVLGYSIDIKEVR